MLFARCTGLIPGIWLGSCREPDPLSHCRPLRTFSVQALWRSSRGPTRRPDSRCFKGLQQEP